MTRRLCMMLAFSFVFLACATGTQQKVETGLATYKNTRDYLLESIREELKPLGGIASEDVDAGTISAEWQVRLSPLDEMGTRTRIVIAYTGNEETGFNVTASQETEMNTNQKAPLELAVAEWKSMASDGNLAARFLQNLDRRLRPNDAWKERRAR